MNKHNLFAEPITKEAILLRPGLVKIVVSRTDEVTGKVTKFPLPVQWTAQEAGELIHLIRGLSWQLSHNDNLPCDYRGIKDLCHKYLYQKVGFIEPISVKWQPKNDKRNTVLS